jgi:hypothetical protein
MLAKLSAREIRSKLRSRPIETVTAELLPVVDWLSEPIEEFLNQGRRKGAATAFLRCSHAIKVGLLRFLEPPSPATRSLVGARLERAAEAVHGYAIWILVPNQMTRDELRRRCLTTVAAMELCEFDLLPDDPPPSMTRAETKLVLEYAKRILLLLLPPLVVYAAHQTGYLTDNTLFSNAVWFAGLWVAVNLGYLLDPQVSAKITAVKDAATILHPAASAVPKK